MGLLDVTEAHRDPSAAPAGQISRRSIEWAREAAAQGRQCRRPRGDSAWRGGHELSGTGNKLLSGVGPMEHSLSTITKPLLLLRSTRAPVSRHFIRPRAPDRTRHPHDRAPSEISSPAAAPGTYVVGGANVISHSISASPQTLLSTPDSPAQPAPHPARQEESVSFESSAWHPGNCQTASRTDHRKFQRQPFRQ